MSQQPSHVVVGLSGGVDSAVAALLLKAQGHRVTAVFMKNWEEDDGDGHCAAAADLRDAEAVCRRLDIPLRAVNFSAEYWERVFQQFLAEYRAGRTPNPDVACNREIKFRAFLEYALDLGAETIATGHYARLGPGPVLRTARDADKDQTYFLSAVPAPALARTVFPLGGMTKAEVRARARAAGLPVHAKRDSTGICFIGERRFRDFLARYLAPRPGPVVSVEGRPLGRHEGLMYYTIGQRQGLGIGGAGGAWYVAGKDTAGNTLIVAQGRDHPALWSGGLTASAPHWIGPPPALPLACTARIRHRQAPAPCRVAARDGGLEVAFETPQWAVAPGQVVAFYDGERCLGGAVIEAAVTRAPGGAPPAAGSTGGAPAGPGPAPGSR